MTILISGGAGFIGSSVIRQMIAGKKLSVVNIDKLTYAGNLDSLESIDKRHLYCFEKLDIGDSFALGQVFKKYQPTQVMHLAAESHVDRSIDGPAEFMETNIIGTFKLLEAAREYYMDFNRTRQENFRFHHISTDEVYGDLAGTDKFFTEQTQYAPSSPYSSREIYDAMCKISGKPALKWSVPKTLFDIASLASPRIKYNF